MDWKRIAPWNWFKEEESALPVTPARAGAAADPFAALRTEMDRLVDDLHERFFPGMAGPASPPGRIPPTLRPSVDISEGKKAYTVRAELPGMELEDLSVEVDDRTLVLRGEKRRETEEEEAGYHCLERSYGAVQRVLSLPDDADGEAIEARFRNGVLELRIPKRAPRASRGRPIEIRGG